MKIKNEYVKIKTDSKETVLHNYIYDSYLKLFSKGQYLTDSDIYSNKFLGSCYLRFDEPLDNYKNATVEDFNTKITYKQYDINGNENNVNITYIYQLPETIIESRTITLKRKITAIGFGSTYGNNIYACIDTSNYTLYYDEAENFTITRKDVFSSNALCDGIEYPIHLVPSIGYEKSLAQNYTMPLAVLYAVGFGTTRGQIKDRRLIYNDFEVEQKSDTEYLINFKNEVTQNKYPQTTRYAGSNKYPVKFYAKRETQPLINRYPSSSKYPLASNYKYVIYQYELYYIDSSRGGESQIIKLNQYYTMSYPIGNTTGLFKIKNKIERK